MTDLEMTRLCAEAMDWNVNDKHPAHGLWCFDPHATPLKHSFWFKPLDNDAQAMALLKKFPMDVFADRGNPFWRVRLAADHNKGFGMADDLNRAIVECVAMLQVDRTAQKTVTRSAAK